ncbi:MAG TPA: acyl-CoA dehydrogenase family protein [Acidimicrobiales bacterium]|nr:acyl-CoA dehydrogenase family protein [Acidimicrobiales bacterium]
MDFDLTQEQAALRDALAVLLDRRAGPARARQVDDAGYDEELDRALDEAGFLGLAIEEGAGPLEAALVVEAVAGAVGGVPIGAHALVGPALGVTGAPRPLVLATDDPSVPVRFGGQAVTALVLRDGTAWCAPVARESSKPIAGDGYPLAYIHLERGTSLGPGSGERLVAWWRVALAAEAVGLMTAGLSFVTAFVQQRRQFDRPISSYQVVQHRLAECAVLLEGCRWLARRAAWQSAPAEESAIAAAHVAEAAVRVGRELHQFSGAIGLTREYDLQLWTTRLQAIRVELGGLHAHRRAAASARWGAGAR